MKFPAGPLFERLDVSSQKISKVSPFVTSGVGWSLDPALVTKWTELENALRSVLKAMYAEYPGAPFEGMLSVPFPSQFGYRKPPWRTRELAGLVLRNSRDAFLAVHGDYRHDGGPPRSSSRDKSWRSHPRQATIDTQRVGVSSTLHLDMETSNGRPAHRETSSFPIMRRFQYLHSLPGSVSSVPGIAATPAATEAGEAVRAFLTRRKEKYEKWEATETSEHKVKRLAREDHASKGAPPGRKERGVFVGKRKKTSSFANHSSCLCRKRMGRVYSHSAALTIVGRMNGISCTALAPEEDAGDDDDGEGFAVNILPSEPELLHSLTFTRFFARRRYLYLVERRGHRRVVEGDDHFYEPFLRQGEYSLFSLWFLLSICSQARSLDDVPRELLDLRQDEGNISVQVWVVDVQRKVLTTRLSISSTRAARATIQDLHIVLRVAATTLEIVRMGWGSLGHSRNCLPLFQRGIEFRLCLTRTVPLPLTTSPMRHVATHSFVLLAAVCRSIAGGDHWASFRGGTDDELAARGPSDEIFENGVRFLGWSEPNGVLGRVL
ncbi:hypothetical protein B0H14DRAFT_2603985 [Mycena olivaceomarginata]|nr:hypothetical protein B0H14DRAFT_2603985 [Mycena olivaceomarginata]